MKSTYVHFDWDTHYLGKLTKLHQTIIVTNFIVFFKQLAIYIEGFINSFYTKCFINSLKEVIWA